MIKKLPKIGKKYKSKFCDRRIVIRVGKYKKDLVCIEYSQDYRGRAITSPNSAFFCEPNNFWEAYEEIKTN